MQITEVTYGCILDACAKTGNMDVALRIYNCLRAKNLVMNSIVFTTLMKGYLKQGAYDQAIAFFKQVKDKKEMTGMLITYNCALDCYVRRDDLASAVALFKEIEQAFGADLVSYSTIIKGFCNNSRKVEALEYVKKMLNANVQNDISVINLFLDSCANQEDYKIALGAYNFIMNKCSAPNEITFGVLIKIFGFAHDLNRAFDQLDLMSVHKIEPSIVIYTNLIHVAFYNKNYKKAEQAFLLFKKTGNRADKLMYSKLINGLLKFASLSRAVKYIDEAIADKASLKPETVQQLRAASKNDPQLEERLQLLLSFEKYEQNEKLTHNKDRFKNNYADENTKKYKLKMREEMNDQANLDNPNRRHSLKRKAKEFSSNNPSSAVRTVNENRGAATDQNIDKGNKEEHKTKEPLKMFNFRKRESKL